MQRSGANRREAPIRSSDQKNDRENEQKNRPEKRYPTPFQRLQGIGNGIGRSIECSSSIPKCSEPVGGRGEALSGNAFKPSGGALRFLAPQHPAHGPLQFVHVRRLRQVSVRAGLFDLLLHLRRIVDGEDNNFDLGR